MAGEGVLGVTTKTSVHIDSGLIAAFLRSPDGPVVKALGAAADKVQTETRRTLKEGFPSDFLGPRVVKRITMAADGVHVLVGADNTKTAPHSIDGNPMLVFEWGPPNGPGGTVFFRHVNHPGSDLGPYLGTKLVAALEAIRRVL